MNCNSSENRNVEMFVNLKQLQFLGVNLKNPASILLKQKKRGSLKAF